MALAPRRFSEEGGLFHSSDLLSDSLPVQLAWGGTCASTCASWNSSVLDSFQTLILLDVNQILNLINSGQISAQ